MYSLVLFCSVPFVMALYEVIVEITKTDIRDYLRISKCQRYCFHIFGEISHSFSLLYDDGRADVVIASVQVIDPE